MIQNYSNLIKQLIRDFPDFGLIFLEIIDVQKRKVV